MKGVLEFFTILMSNSQVSSFLVCSINGTNVLKVLLTSKINSEKILFQIREFLEEIREKKLLLIIVKRND